MKLFAKEAVLLSTLLLLGLICLMPKANANPDPLLVSWQVQDADFQYVDGATLKIYWADDPAGPWSAMDASIVQDKINNAYQNPIISGYFNPDKPHGWAVADLHVTDVESHYFYVEIEYDSVTEYWPTEASWKPGDPSWGYPVNVVEADNDAGFAATGNGLGNGPTTAYPTRPPPPNWVPEVPFGTIMSFLSMFTMLAGFIGVRHFRRKPD